MSPRVEACLPGIVVVVLGVVFCVGAQSYGVTSGGRMGPGLMPMLAGLGLIVLGAAIAVSAGRSADESETPVDDVTARTGQVGGDDGSTAVTPTEYGSTDSETGHAAVIAQDVHHPRRPWIILGTAAAGLLLAPYVGLIPGLALMAFVILRFVEHESWRIAVSVTVGLLVFSWFVFEEFLAVNLPWGVFGGLM